MSFCPHVLVDIIGCSRCFLDRIRVLRQGKKGEAVPAPGRLCNSHFMDGETEDQRSNEWALPHGCPGIKGRRRI